MKGARTNKRRRFNMFRAAIKLSMMICVILAIAIPIYPQDVWVGKDGAIRSADARAMLINNGEFYIATKKELFKAKNLSEKWESVFSLPAGINEINCVGGRKNLIYIGTKRGLFRSEDYGARWQKVFKTIIPEKNDVSSVELSTHMPNRVIIGTASGIFISEDSGNRWQDISANLKNRRMKCLALNGSIIYAAGADGLFAKKEGVQGWERLYVRSAAEKSLSGEEAQSEISDTTETEEAVNGINCIAIKDDYLYIGLNNKVLYSKDGGRTWTNLSGEGLSGTVNRIRPAPKSDTIYCATTKGAFEYSPLNGSRWLQLYKGMDKNYSVSDIMFDNEAETSLWAVTGKGLYRLESARYIGEQYIDVERSLNAFSVISTNEPTFKELQQAAMRFAEVSPDKIKNWRQEARMKALLPKVSFGYDNSISSTSEIYTSGTRDYIVVGPDDISKGLDVSISWELGDIIFSDDQTNIDVRSRLTTQLRNDILDDLRRSYYERKRLQFELIQTPPQDPKARFEKELRLQELSQAVDDLTGNYLSDHIRK